jgi:hypothetical protein
MKILVIGGGGREHALVWKLGQSSKVEKIWCAPGNGGIAAEAECLPVSAGDVAGIVAMAEKLGPNLTVVGPELPLVNGLVDAFEQRGWPIAGPTKNAAQLEGSKIFTKEFLQRHEIPTALMYGAYDSGRRAVVHFAYGWRELRDAGADAGPQAGVRQQRRPEYGGHGGLLDGRIATSESATDNYIDNRGTNVEGINQGRHSVQRLFLRGTNANQRGTESSGIQLPAGRPGNAGDCRTNGF